MVLGIARTIDPSIQANTETDAERNLDPNAGATVEPMALRCQIALRRHIVLRRPWSRWLVPRPPRHGLVLQAPATRVDN
jgi:hypothetical protein